MGSPYVVHKQVNRIHVVKSAVGFERILSVLLRSMSDTLSIYTIDTCSPEWFVLNDVTSAFFEAMDSNSRALTFLGARYDWRGWEKFQRVIVFDFTGKDGPQWDLTKPLPILNCIMELRRDGIIED